MFGRTRIALVAAVAALSLAVAAAPATAGTLDQQQTSRDAIAPINGPTLDDISVAQTFTPARSGMLDRVDLFLGQDASGPLTVEIRDVDLLGAPGSGVPLASASVPAAAVGLPDFGSDTFVEVPFASPAPVLAGTQYAIVAYTGGADRYRWWGISSNLYPGGALFVSRASPPATWLSAASVDLAFKTYVVPLYEASDFFAPIKMTELNIAQAGKTVPVKWRVTDSEGNPVSDPTHFESVTSRGDTCESGPTDAIEDYSGESGLQYLGDGYWQFNWKTLKDYAGQCRTLTLSLSDGGTLKADFQFKK